MIKLSKSEEEEIRHEDKSKIDWNDISKNFMLREDFIEKFKNELNWALISCYQKLSSNSIRKFSDRILWSYASIHQKFSSSIIEEFQDKINLYCVCTYQKLSEKSINKIINLNKFDDDIGNYIVKNQKLTLDLINNKIINNYINFELCYFANFDHPNKWKTFL